MKCSRHKMLCFIGDLQDHLELMFSLLRSEDTIKVVSNYLKWFYSCGIYLCMCVNLHI